MADVLKLGNRILKRRKKLGLTLQEVADLVGVTKSTIQRYETGKIETPKLPVIQAIAKALNANPSWLIGKSEREEAISSFLTSAEACEVPLLELSPDGIFEYDKKCMKFADNTKDNTDFCIKMSGDSMTGARIYSGDIVFIKRQNDVNDGEIAAVMVNNEITLKRVIKLNDKIMLRSENPAYPPVILEGDMINTFKILGKAISFQSKLIF